MRFARSRALKIGLIFLEENRYDKIGRLDQVGNQLGRQTGNLVAQKLGR